MADGKAEQVTADERRGGRYPVTSAELAAELERVTGNPQAATAAEVVDAINAVARRMDRGGATRARD